MQAIVAIPACNEAEHIEHCLAALERQTQVPGRVVLLVNNSTDETAFIARSVAWRAHFPIDIIEQSLSAAESSAGHARRLVMAEALAGTTSGDVLFTTDADAVVPPDWIAANLKSIVSGADVVCGRAIIDPSDALLIPPHLQADDKLERRLLDLLDALAWHLDPEPHNPPPRHMEASGASLAVSAQAYCRVGGIPAMASGEDRAFVRALWMMDAVIRHDPEIQVTVSGRINGRARGGMADTIRRRLKQQDEFTDANVEPAYDAAQRYSLRHQVRAAWAGVNRSKLSALLDVPHAAIQKALQSVYFGAAWATLERQSPILRRQRVRFRDLLAEIETAETLLRHNAPPNALVAE